MQVPDIGKLQYDIGHQSHTRQFRISQVTFQFTIPRRFRVYSTLRLELQPLKRSINFTTDPQQSAFQLPRETSVQGRSQIYNNPVLSVISQGSYFVTQPLNFFPAKI